MSDSGEEVAGPARGRKKKRRVGEAWGDIAAVLDATSVVKLFCRELKPNYSMPWTTKRQQSSTSSAFIISIEERLLLTNRHCVAHASCIEVRKRGDDEKFEADVLARATDCDLALLTVRSDEFWTSSLTEQKMSEEVPALFSEVVCVGYPTGGDNLSVTKGVVSRLDYEDNADPWRNRLVIQIDAAVNPGNSGGPALVAGGSCVGVAYESLKDGSTENIGFIIPVSVVQKFLAAWRKSKAPDSNVEKEGEKEITRVTAFGHGRFYAQKLENVAMRRALGMAKGQSGVLVKSVDPTTVNAEVLRRGDVILSLGGVTIGNDGCVPFACGTTRHDRVPFPYVAINQFVGDHLEAKVLRAGTEITCRLQLSPQEPLVPIEKEAPWLLDYAVIGGLVFVVLSQQYLRATFGEKWRKERCGGLAEILDSRARESSDEQVVVLSYVLAHTVNLGFQDVRNSRLKALVLNGTTVRVRNLKHLTEAVEACKEEFLRFELFPRGAGFASEVIVLERAAVKATEQEILRRNKIPAAKRISEIFS